jgi:hypothetical protein
MREVTPTEQDRLLAVLERNERQLRRVPGVHHVDVGYRYVGGRPTGQLAIRLHVGEKTSGSRLDGSAGAPATVEGVPTDIIESKPGPHQRRDERFDPVCGGIATTNTTRLAGEVGTLGAVVFDRQTGAAMALSNHHVYAGPDGRVGDSISQPRSLDDADVIGTLTRMDAGLDCAVATLNITRPGTSAVVDFPDGVSVLHEPLLGWAVTKSGRTTGTTRALIDGVSSDAFTVVPDPDRPAPGGEISSGGDSGAIWLRADLPFVGVGLHFAGETGANTDRAWAKRLTRVAATLGIRFRRLPAEPVAAGNSMRSGEVLNAGQSVSSTDGRFTLTYQGDGNLVLRREGDGVPLWSSGTGGTPVGVCLMQSDGNLAILDPDIPVWSSGTPHAHGCRLVVQDDGNVVIHRPDGIPVWATGTVHPGTRVES